MLLRWSPLALPWKRSTPNDGHATTAHLPISVWECLVLAPAAFSVGMTASACFVGIGASVTEEQSAIAISVMFLSQQIGLIVGAAGGVGFARIGFGSFLKRELGPREGSEEVSAKSTFLLLIEIGRLKLQARCAAGD